MLNKNFIVTIREDGSRRVSFVCKEKSLTHQSFKDECDPKRIVAKYNSTGVMPNCGRAFTYANVSELPDFKTGTDKVNTAKDIVKAMPKVDVRKVRKSVSNNQASSNENASAVDTTKVVDVKDNVNK